MSDAPTHEPVSQCPGCGSELRWQVGTSRVIVCEYCRYASVRGDKGLEGIGKVADVIATGSRLALGASGRLEGVRFRLVGRLQLQWEQGAWDEWYAALDDGRWAWISEAGGHFYASFRVAPRALPPLASLKPERQLTIPGLGRYVVTDLRHASYAGAKGELPEVIGVGGEKVTLVDLAGAGGAFATLDFSDGPPTIFAGRELTLDELAIETESASEQRESARVTAKAITCANCNAPLDVMLPGFTQRLVCGHCGALLDASEGPLRVVEALEKQRKQYRFTLGQPVALEGEELRFVGWLERECHVEGQRYVWDEYLLFHEKSASFRYLVCSEGHWSFVVPVSAGDVESGSNRATWKGRSFRAFSTVTASVSGVAGEFPWAVALGESARIVDFIAPPEGLSAEKSESEFVWSHSKYLTPREVWTAFGVKAPLREPDSAGMIQPNPHEATARGITSIALAAVAATVALFVYFSATTRESIVLAETVQLAEGEGVDPSVPADADAPAEAAKYATAVAFTAPFDIPEDRRNLRARLSSNINNGWVFATFALINEETNEFEDFQLESSRYSGSDSDGAWVEDDRTQSAYLHSVPKGRYLLRIEAQWEKGKPPPNLSIELRSGVTRFLWFALALASLLVIPIWVRFRRSAFEQARWEAGNIE